MKPFNTRPSAQWRTPKPAPGCYWTRGTLSELIPLPLAMRLAPQRARRSPWLRWAQGRWTARPYPGTWFAWRLVQVSALTIALMAGVLGAALTDDPIGRRAAELNTLADCPIVLPYWRPSIPAGLETAKRIEVGP